MMGFITYTTQAQPVIIVGTHHLVANQPGQVLTISVSGGDPVYGVNLNVQVANGGPEAEATGHLPPGAGIDGPAITAVDLLNGTILQANNDGQVDALDRGEWPQLACSFALTNEGTVSADGVLAQLTFDTTGFYGGTCALRLGKTLNGPTDFSGDPATITDGLLVVDPLETTLQHDTVTSGGNAAVMTGFRAGDIAASVFTLPPGVQAMKIKSIDAIMGVDPTYGAVETICDLQLYCGGTLDTPTATKEGGAFNPGVNRMDLSTEGWIVRSDFAIGLRYNWAVGDIDHKSTHIVTDLDGCQSGANYAFDAVTGEWLDPCAQGVPGDFAIRVTAEVIPSRAPFGDFNHDDSVDMADFGAFQRCMTVDSGTSTSPDCLVAFDCDDDGRVDGNDLSQFESCVRGPGMPLDPTCGDCLPAGFCEAQPGPMQVTLGTSPRPALSWTIVIIVVLLALVFLVSWNYLSPLLIIDRRNSWIATAQCPTSTTRQLQLKEAMVYLRDDLGRTDADAFNIGNYMMNGKWYECGGHIMIPTGPNPSDIYASTHVPGLQIFIDEQFFEEWQGKERLAIILYGQAGHFMSPSGALVMNPNERMLNQRLDSFLQRHTLQWEFPEYRHGAREGVTNDGD